MSIVLYITHIIRDNVYHTQRVQYIDGWASSLQLLHLGTTVTSGSKHTSKDSKFQMLIYGA